MLYEVITGQSSNDVIPTTIHIAAAVEIRHSLIPALFALQEALGEKAEAFDDSYNFV